MRLPSIKRINKADFPEQDANFINRLAGIYNSTVEMVYEALNNKLTLRDNISCDVKDLYITVDSDGVPLTYTGFNLSDGSKRIEGLSVYKADNTTNTSTYPSGAPFINYVQVGNNIEIKHITGLQANNTYQVRIVVYYQ